MIFSFVGWEIKSHTVLLRDTAWQCSRNHVQHQELNPSYFYARQTFLLIMYSLWSMVSFLLICFNMIFSRKFPDRFSQRDLHLILFQGSSSQIKTIYEEERMLRALGRFIGVRKKVPGCGSFLRLAINICDLFHL